MRELDLLVQDAGKDGQMTEANLYLNASPHFKCMQLILAARFGYCIQYAVGKLPALWLYDLPVDILSEPDKISILPYFLDHETKGARWINLIRGLIHLKRLDLLNQLQFSKITSRQFHELMSVPLPELVFLAATKSLLANGADPALSSFLAWSRFGGQAAPWPKNCRVPLFFCKITILALSQFQRAWSLSMGCQSRPFHSV